MKRNFRVRLLQTAAIITLLGSAAASLAATGSFEKTIAIDGDVILDVSNQKGSVVVRGGDVNKVTIKARITIDKRYGRGEPHKSTNLIGEIRRSPPIESDGNRIVVRELTKHRQARYAMMSYEILVPRDTTVTVRSVSGDVKVSGISGEVNATSDTGKVTVAELDDEDTAGTNG